MTRCLGFAYNSSRQGDGYVGMTYVSLSLFVFGPLNPGPQQGKRRVPNIGPPGNSRVST